ANAAPQGQTGSQGDPWVQPMPKSMTANSVGDALGGDSFTAPPAAGQRTGASAGQTSGASQGQASAAGVRIRNVNARQVVEDQASPSSAAADAAGDPFAGLAPP